MPRSWQCTLRRFNLLAVILALGSAAYAVEPTCIPDKEPNDRPETAMPVTGTFCVEGSIGENDQDILAWSVSNADAGQAWTIELEGIPGQETKVQLHRIEEPAQADTPATVSAEFFSIATPTGTNRASATDIFVTPGNYLLGLSVSGTADPKATYTLVLRRAGLLVPETEREPNDTQTTATPLGQARSVRGRLVGLERDTFRFEVQGKPQLWRAEVAGRGVKEFALLDKHGMPAGSRRPMSDIERLELSNLFLMPGEHWIAVEGENADYVVTLEPTGVPDPNMEHEPNDNEERAHKLEFGVTRTGTLSEATDQDVYRFSLPTTDHVALRLDPPTDAEVAIRLTWVHPSPVRPSSVAIGKPIIYDAVLAPGDYYVTLSAQKESKNPYRLTLVVVFDRGPTAVKPTEPLPLRMSLDLGKTPVAAYWIRGQRVRGTLELVNEGGKPLDLSLAAVASQPAVGPRFARPTVRVAAGAREKVPLEIHVAPDAKADPAVLVSVHARAADGARRSVAAPIRVEITAAPLEEEDAFSLPAGLLGGFNIAWSALGGTVVAPEGDPLATEQALLHDGLTPTEGFQRDASALPIALTVAFGGDNAWPVAGNFARLEMNDDKIVVRSGGQLTETTILILPCQRAPEFLMDLAARNALANKPLLDDFASDPFAAAPANFVEVFSKMVPLPGPAYTLAATRFENALTRGALQNFGGL
jgi:hypothetical protein